jgi:YVTN family beta-propeller protein
MAACGRSELQNGDTTIVGSNGAGGGAADGTGGLLTGAGGHSGTGGFVAGTGGARVGTGGHPGTAGAGIGTGGHPGTAGIGGGGRGGRIGTDPVYVVPIDGALRDILIDPKDDHIYVTNATHNWIEDFSLLAMALQPPIPVGSAPNGFDITLDGSRLYVANSGGTNISVVDLATRQEIKKIDVKPSGFTNDTPYSLAIAANGKALFSTTFAGSGFGARMMTLDLTTEAVSLKSDFFIAGTTTEATVLKASADGAIVAAIAGDISSAPVFVYRASTDAFSPERDLDTFISTVAVNRDGSVILVDGSYVLDSSLNLRGTISGRSPGAVFAPSGPVAYRTSGKTVEVLDTAQFVVTATVDIPDTLQQTYNGSNIGAMVVTSNARRMAIITDHGISLVDLP